MNILINKIDYYIWKISINQVNKEYHRYFRDLIDVFYDEDRDNLIYGIKYVKHPGHIIWINNRSFENHIRDRICNIYYDTNNIYINAYFGIRVPKYYWYSSGLNSRKGFKMYD